MLKNYIKISIRNIWRNKIYALINILGLSIGLTCCLLISLYVQDEYSYDTHHANRDRIYRVLQTDSIKSSFSASTPPPLGPVLSNDYGGIESTVRIYDLNKRKVVLENGESFMLQGLLVDQSYFDIFSSELVAGDLKSALNTSENIVISESTAHNLFGGLDALNQVVTVFGEVKLKIAAIIKDSPANSHIQFQFLAPFQLIGGEEQLAYWGQNYHQTFVLTREDANIAQLQEEIFDIKDRYFDNVTHSKVTLQPLNEMHLDNSIDHNFANVGNATTVDIFALIAILVLVVACVNFMNLSTAKASLRYKEVGLRKVIGASKKQLITQFLGESFLISVLSISLAILFSDLLLPSFNYLSGKNFTTEVILGTYSIVDFSLILGGLLFVTTFLGGTYPALLLSNFQPIQILKASSNVKFKGFSLRKVLVVFQLVFSIGLIISTLIISEQMSFIKEKDLGWDKANLINIPLRGDLGKKYTTFKEQLLTYDCINNATAVSELPIDVGTAGVYEFEGMDKDKVHTIGYMNADRDFFNTFNLKSSNEFPLPQFTKGQKNYVINETALEEMRSEWGEGVSPIGKELDGGTIVGVVKDFHFKPLHEKISGIVYGIEASDNYGRYGNLVVRSKSGRLSETIDVLNKEFKKLGLDQELEYSFVDDIYNNKYQTEQRVGGLAKVFTLLAVLISFIGLLSLVSFTTEQRVKEIGVRKVLGASISKIVLMLSKDYLIMVIIALIIASPLVYVSMNQWLTDFAYHITPGATLFLVAGLLVGIAVGFMVSLQSMHYARINPADTLRNE